MGIPSVGKPPGLTGSLVFSVFTCALGSSFLFGYNLGVLNSPQAVVGLWIRELKCIRNGGTPNKEEGESEDIWCSKLDVNGEAGMFIANSELNQLWTIIVAIFSGGSLIGCLSTSFFANRFGRKGTLFWNSFIAIFAAAVMGFSQLAGSYEMLIVGRLIAGLNAGISAGVPPVYFTEISPTILRGAIGSLHQLFLTIAILVSQILGLPDILGNAWGWPILVGLSAVPAIYQLIALPFCPESPKFLFITKRDENAARKALEKLRGTTDVNAEIKEIQEEFEETNYIPIISIWMLFKDPFLRKVTLIAAGLMACQELSGIDAVMFYSTSIFQSAGLTAQTAMFATIGMGAINVGMTIVSLFLVEKAGRRTLLLIGYIGSTVFIGLLTISMMLFKSGSPGPEFPGAVNSYGFAAYTSMTCVIAFVIMFATGPGSIPWFLVTELFEQGARASAMTVAVATNRVCNFILVLSFPLIQVAIAEYTFLIFFVLLVIFDVFTYFTVIETKGKSIEEIQRELRKGRSRALSSNAEVSGDISMKML